MLVIKINDEVLTFDLYELGWVGSDEALASVLNGMLPEEIGSPQMAFSTEGTEGAVLRYLQKIWPELKVVVFEPEPPPPEIPGVVYSIPVVPEKPLEYMTKEEFAERARWFLDEPEDIVTLGSDDEGEE